MSVLLTRIFVVAFAIGAIMMIGSLGWLITLNFTGPSLVFILGLYLFFVSIGLGSLFKAMGLFDD